MPQNLEQPGARDRKPEPPPPARCPVCREASYISKPCDNLSRCLSGWLPHWHNQCVNCEYNWAQKPAQPA